MVKECPCWAFFASSNVGHSWKIIVLALWTNFARFSGIHRKFAQRTIKLCRQPWQMRKISWIWSVACGFARGLLVRANATDLAPKATVQMLHYNQTHFPPSFPCRTRLAFMNHHFSSFVQKCTGWTQLAVVYFRGSLHGQIFPRRAMCTIRRRITPCKIQICPLGTRHTFVFLHRVRKSGEHTAVVSFGTQ